jgi:hypothetical protein
MFIEAKFEIIIFTYQQENFYGVNLGEEFYEIYHKIRNN